MSLWNKTGDALPPPRLDFATLVARLDRAHRPVPVPCELAHRFRDMTPAQCLVTVVLGRDGWPQAARALGGCFVPGAC